MTTRNEARIETALKGALVGLALALGTFAEHAWQVLATLPIALIFLGASLEYDHLRRRWVHPNAISAPILVRWLVSALEHSLRFHIALPLSVFAGAALCGVPFLPLLIGTLLGMMAGLAYSEILRLRPTRLQQFAVIAFFAILGVSAWLLITQGWITAASPIILGIALLLVVPLLGLAFFVGRCEESDYDTGLWCALLALGLYQLPLTVTSSKLVLLLPLGIFVLYSERMRRGLLVFKYSYRGATFEEQGDIKSAFINYRIALKHDPRATMAQRGNWRLHQKINLLTIAEDKDLLPLIDARECLARARQLLAPFDQIAIATDESETLDEIQQLLDLVATLRDDLPLTLAFERTRLQLATDDLGIARETALALVDRSPMEINALFQSAPHEAEAVYRTWKLLLTDARLMQVGMNLLDEPRRSLDVLACLEARLKLGSDEKGAAFRPFLYSRLQWLDYRRYCNQNPDDDRTWFDHSYCAAQAHLLLEDKGDQRRESVRRAVELLQIAEDGLPAERLRIWLLLADLSEETGDFGQAERWRTRIVDLGAEIGPSLLSDPQRQAFLEAAERLAQDANAASDTDRALELYQLLVRTPGCSLANLSHLTQLYLYRQEWLNALEPTAAALKLKLDAQEREDWKELREILYDRLAVRDVQARLMEIRHYLDFDYCYQLAKTRFAKERSTAEIQHLLEIAALGGEVWLDRVNFLLGKIHHRDESWEEAALCLEQVRGRKPDRFPDKEAEENYYAACRLLGQVYLGPLGRPEEAAACYHDFAKSDKSGADTLFHLGEAYEAAGKLAHARKWYDMVLVYPSHPRAEAARAALDRLAKTPD